MLSHVTGKVLSIFFDLREERLKMGLPDIVAERRQQPRK